MRGRSTERRFYDARDHFIECCVPFCKRTRGDRKNDPVAKLTEWICADHWRMVDKDLRLRRGFLRRRWKHRDFARWHKIDGRLWRTIKKQAIERAAGI